MSLNFQQVQNQVKELGEKAPQREQRLKALKERANELLESHAKELEALRQKVNLAARIDPNLRCALPVEEPLDAHYALPPLAKDATLLAADGSQITLNRHAAVEYCLVNVGAIQTRQVCCDPPSLFVKTELFYDEALYTESGTITDATLALLRDVSERKMLADMAQNAPWPVISFTDGPMELWGARDSDSATEYQHKLEEYKKVLLKLCELRVAAAGYVDKPASNLVVRLLEVAVIPEPGLSELRKLHPLRGVKDLDLFSSMLAPGERSAVFAFQSKSAANYPDELAIHFFYLNVGREDHPSLARVEIPQWVAGDRVLLDELHAALVDQCRILGSRHYPYLLHRAHETAVVKQEEQEQVTQMIALELRRRGVTVGEASQKQAVKDLSGRTSYKG